MLPKNPLAAPNSILQVTTSLKSAYFPYRQYNPKLRNSTYQVETALPSFKRTVTFQREIEG